MKLTVEDKKMLAGERGPQHQKCMELLVGMGECYGAEKLIPIKSVHLLPTQGDFCRGANAFVKEISHNGGKFAVYTDINPLRMDPRQWQEQGFTKEGYEAQSDMVKNYARMGVFLSQTCAPYQTGQAPRFGEHIAWSESSAVVYANSVLGARTNKEGGFTSFAAGLIGRTPEYGFHLDENRYGTMEIRVTAGLNGIADYGALGYFMGKVASNQVPVLTGVPPTVSLDELKHLGAAADYTGAIALFHIVGVTPEAPTKKAAFGLKKPGTWEVVEFGKKELEVSNQALSNAPDRDVNIVVFGCPHVSIQELRDIARLVEGKKVKPGVELWIVTSRMTKAYADNMGYLKIIKSSGAKILMDACCVPASENFLKSHGLKIMTTNSAKWADHMTDWHMFAQYGSTEKCIDAAVRGKWR